MSFFLWLVFFSLVSCIVYYYILYMHTFKWANTQKRSIHVLLLILSHEDSGWRNRFLPHHKSDDLISSELKLKRNQKRDTTLPLCVSVYVSCWSLSIWSYSSVILCKCSFLVSYYSLATSATAPMFTMCFSLLCCCFLFFFFFFFLLGAVFLFAIAATDGCYSQNFRFFLMNVSHEDAVLNDFAYVREREHETHCYWNCCIEEWQRAIQKKPADRNGR